MSRDLCTGADEAIRESRLLTYREKRSQSDSDSTAFYYSFASGRSNGPTRADEG